MPEEDRQMSEVYESAGAAEVEWEASGWALRFMWRAARRVSRWRF